MKNKFLFEMSYHHKQKCKIYVINSITILVLQISTINLLQPNIDNNAIMR
jgi:hypothetical protein